MADVIAYTVSYLRKYPYSDHWTPYPEEEVYFNKDRAEKLFAQYQRSKRKSEVKLTKKVLARDIPDLDKFITWWINYYSKAIGQKITWRWKVLMGGNQEERAIALAYRDDGYIAISQVYFYNWWVAGRRDMIKDVIAHEVMHFKVPDEHHGPKFKAGMKKWSPNKKMGTTRAE
jgi:predicted metal-dependent hydrolase